MIRGAVLLWIAERAFSARMPPLMQIKVLNRMERENNQKRSHYGDVRLS